MSGAEARKEEVLYDEAAITARIDEMALEVIERYADKNPLFVCFLKGGVLFTSRLMSSIAAQADTLGTTFHPDVDYMIISTYGNETTAGESEIVTDLADKTVVAGRPVIMIDDVLETGRTMYCGEQHLLANGATSVESIVMVQKIGQERSLYPEATIYGFTAPHDKWLTGVGMNKHPDHPKYPEACRWLGYISAVSFE